jgi:hypothetical protein
VSGSTIGGVVGAVVGFYFGGPQGAQYGWMIGSAVGGYVDPTLIKAPRLADLRSQTSAVGGAIPRAWGTAPVPGNVLWQGPVVTHTTVDDGKGSGTEQEVKTRTRSYAIMFHLGEIAGVLQIKRNGKIVLDRRDEATLQAEYEEAMGPLSSVEDWTNRVKLQFAMNSKWSNKCRIYTGTQTQEPDPTIEAYLGVGNAPAYRGRAYMVVTDDETQAGEIAQYEIIVAACGTVSTSAATGASWLSTYTADGNTLEISPNALDWSGTPFHATGWAPGIGTASAKHGTEILFFYNGISMYSPDFGQTRYVNNTGLGSNGLGAVWLGGYWFVANGGAGGTLRSSDGLTFASTPGFITSNTIGKVGSRLVVIGHGGDPGLVRTSDDLGGSWTDRGFLPNAFNPSAQTRLADDGGSTLACICVENGSFGGTAANDTRAHILYTSDDAVSWDEGTNPFPDQIDITATTYIHYARTLGLWVVVFHNRVAYGPSIDALTLSSHVFPHAPTHIDSDAGLIVACGAGGMIETSADGNTWEAQSFGSTADIFAVMSLYDPESQSAIPDAPAYYVDEDGNVTGPPSTVITPCGTTTVGEIVQAVCELSGLTTDEIDVSQLTDTLDGYVIARETDAASVIESLRPVGMFDPAEWDGKLRFIKRGGTAVGSINGDDLVERDGDAVEREMVQEVELLRKVSVGYLDTAAAWAPNTQPWERTVGTIAARGESVVEVTAVMDADQAATIAKRKGLVSWGEPEKQKYSLLSLRHAKYTPTDILNLTHNDAEVDTVRLMQIEDDSGIREIESSLNCAEAYNATATGVAPKPPTITDATLRGATNAVYMNLPSLRTQDNVPGVTIAACGVMAGWQGTAILLSEDNGVSYQQITTFTQPTAMGRLTAACTASSEPIAVRMQQGSLSSITDAQLALRHNAFAIVTDDVAELGQFKTATATATNAYDLTENVRGRLGTTAATHAVGDPFVMVAAAQFVPLDISLAGRTLYFKAVTFGTSQDAAESVPFVFNPLFTSVSVEAYTDDNGFEYTDDADNIYYYEASA